MKQCVPAFGTACMLWCHAPARRCMAVDRATSRWHVHGCSSCAIPSCRYVDFSLNSTKAAQVCMGIFSLLPAPASRLKRELKHYPLIARRTTTTAGLIWAASLCLIRYLSAPNQHAGQAARVPGPHARRAARGSGGSAGNAAILSGVDQRGEWRTAKAAYWSLLEPALLANQLTSAAAAVLPGPLPQDAVARLANAVPFMPFLANCRGS